MFFVGCEDSRTLSMPFHKEITPLVGRLACLEDRVQCPPPPHHQGLCVVLQPYTRWLNFTKSLQKLAGLLMVDIKFELMLAEQRFL